MWTCATAVTAVQLLPGKTCRGKKTVLTQSSLDNYSWKLINKWKKSRAYISSLSRVREQSYNREVSILIPVFVFLLLSGMGICSAAVNPHTVKDRCRCPVCLVKTQSPGRGFFGFLIYTVLIRYQWSQWWKIRSRATGILSLSLSFSSPARLLCTISGHRQSVRNPNLGKRQSHHVEGVCLTHIPAFVKFILNSTF